MTEASDAPILEFDPSPTAILEPSRLIKAADVPEHAVICFFNDVVTHLAQKHEMTVVKRLRTEIGRHPVWETVLHGKRLAIFHPGVGAPLAAALLEEVIALGCRKFIACGGAGVLDSDVAMGHVLVPTSAVRDEGTSYHYLPPSREVAPSADGVAAIEATLAAHAVPYRTIKTWTTDAIYRETAEKMKLRKAEGCLAVEMEAAAFFAVARFRGVSLAQMLYGGDDLAGESWDGREWDKHPGREKLFWLAAEACLRL